MLSAAMARSIAASLMEPVAAMPSPSRMIRENESTTRNPSPAGLASGSQRNLRESKHFRCFSMQDQPSPSSLENAIALQKYGVGQPVRRKEDDTLVRGKGKYTDDFTLPGQAYCWMVRSSHAHGIIKGIDTTAAKAMPGVLGAC